MWPQTPPLGHPARAPTPATDGLGHWFVCAILVATGCRLSQGSGLASQLVQSPNRPSRLHVVTSHSFKSRNCSIEVFVCVSESDEGVYRSPAGSGRRGAPGAQPEPASCLSATGEQVRGAAPDPASRHSHHTHWYLRVLGGVGRSPTRNHTPHARPLALHVQTPGLRGPPITLQDSRRVHSAGFLFYLPTSELPPGSLGPSRHYPRSV